MKKRREDPIDLNNQFEKKSWLFSWGGGWNELRKSNPRKL